MVKLAGRILALLCMIPFLGSCVYDYPPESEDSIVAADSKKVVLQLNIQPLATTVSDIPTEKIKSLRVIIVRKGETATVPDTIECNRLIPIPESIAKNYSYTYIWNSNPGKKDIFVIANESSVDTIITPLLDKYVEQQPADGFAAFVNGYSFSPTYSIDNGNIYLPYTFCKEDLDPVAGVVNTVNAWLVPVATKFIFKFTNSRPNAIKINGISMKYANKENYLLARLGQGELEKELNGQPVGWLDWLAEISKNSWLYPDYGDNVEYNGEVGWIIDYKLPDPGDASVFTFVKENDPSEIFTVPGASSTVVDGIETTTDGSYTTSVYYLPESANFQRFGSDQTGESNNSGGDGQEESEEPEHRFYLTMLFEDTAPNASTPPVFEDIAIPNLKSLFRNTFVVVTLKMSEGDIELYAEIADWNNKTANGWVNEGNEPSNNPFKIKKKW